MTGRAREVPVEGQWELLARRGKVKLTKKVHVLVDCVALNSWEAQLLNELSAKVFNVARESSNLQRLGLCSLKVL